MTQKPVPTEPQIEPSQLVDARTVELIERAVQIEQEDARAAGTVSFVSRIFCQVALPYRDPGPEPSWRRSNGTVTLRLTPGLITAKGGQQIDAYPFGVMPRYLLAWMTSEVKQSGPAVQDDGLTLDLGGSMRAFLRQIGINSATGRRRPTQSRFRTRVLTKGVTPSLHVEYKHARIKQYLILFSNRGNVLVA